MQIDIHDDGTDSYLAPLSSTCGQRRHLTCQVAGCRCACHTADPFAEMLAETRRDLNALHEPTDQEVRDHWHELWALWND